MSSKMSPPKQDPTPDN